MIADFSKGYVGDLSNLPSEDESTPEFHPKEHFAGDFQSKMDELVLDILTECNFPNLVAARFNLASFDVEVNGHKKESFQGQGYSSFLNSVVAVAFRQYLFDKATHDPGVLIIDTPLLELDQGVGDASPDSMRTALYTYFAKHQDCGQIILFDNIKNIPDVDFESFGTNVITFTKGYMQGRYGFLLDVTE